MNHGDNLNRHRRARRCPLCKGACRKPGVPATRPAVRAALVPKHPPLPTFTERKIIARTRRPRPRFIDRGDLGRMDLVRRVAKP